jgi:protoporphyrinogen oxidase
MTPIRVAILGAGPAGVAAAWRLRRESKAHALVVEQRDDVGGNAGSFEIDGVPVDYGSHRLHPACPREILRDLRELLGRDLLERPRHGRIRLRDRWIRFPLRPLDLVAHMQWTFGLGVARDAVSKVAGRRGEAESFAGELERGLGPTICRDFYFPYAVKIWGLAPEELSAAQARRRVSAGSLAKLLRRILSSVPGFGTAGAGRFFYPRHGYGQISRAIATAARRAGAEIVLGTTVRSVRLGSPHRVEVEQEGALRTLEAEHVWSTIPVTALARLLVPAAPAEVSAVATELRYRAMVLIYLSLGRDRFTPYDAHYFPGREVTLTRLSEPKNYSGRSDPAGRTVLCAEVPCEVDDPVWRSTDAQLRDQVCNDLERCGLPAPTPIRQVVTRRLASAYPVYRRGYEESLRRIDEWLDALPGVLTFGRQGLFAHDNTHHTLAMAYAAVDCLGPAGHFDRERWRSYRTDFESHVVED